MVASGVKLGWTTHVLGSLAAHLFTPLLVNYDYEEAVQRESSFNNSAFLAPSDIAPVLDIVSSTQIYGGELPPWTTSAYSLLNFTEPKIFPRTIGLSNFSIATTAYSADVDSVTLPSSQFGLTRQGQGQGCVSEASDRGCVLQEPDIFSGPVVANGQAWFE